MKKAFQLLFLSLCFYSCSYAQSTNISVGNSFTIESKILNESRTLFIYLPPAYQTSKKNYPVIYLLDGETHFTYTAGVVEFLSRNGIMPASIVIGITNQDRNRDFTPTVSKNIPGSGGAGNFLRFLEKELIPFVDDNYRTQPNRTMIGHSLCGLFSFYTLLHNPSLINSFIAISPWFVYDINYMMELSESSFKKLTSLNKYLYFTAGSAEQQDVIASMSRYTEFLEQKAPKDLRWSYNLMNGEDHGSLVLMSIYDGLKNLYEGWRVPDSVLSKGLHSIINHFKFLSERFSYKITPPEETLNGAGYFFLQRKDFEKAMELFKKNVDLYPESANVYDSRGEAFERAGKIKEAKENYAKACDIAEKNNDPNLSIFRNNLFRINNITEIN